MKEGGDLQVPQGLSWFLAAVLPSSSRWQHIPTVPFRASAGLVGKSGSGFSFDSQVPALEWSSLCLRSSLPSLFLALLS